MPVPNSTRGPRIAPSRRLSTTRARRRRRRSSSRSGARRRTAAPSRCRRSPRARWPSSRRRRRRPASRPRGSSCPTPASRWPAWPPASTAIPAANLQVVGITGTNGKTTTAYLLSALFEAAGLRCGMLGTIVYRIGAEEREATQDDARVGGRPADAARDGVARVQGVRDGGVVPRPGAAPRGRPALLGRRLHQPDARPPRLPRRHGVVLRREAPAVRTASGPTARPSSTSTTRAARSCSAWPGAR